MKTISLPRQFVCSAGVLLLAATLALFISIWAGRGLIHPHEPLFGMSLPKFFCIAGGFELAIAVVCLFGQNTFLQTVLILWLAVNFAAYQVALWWIEGSAGFKGYLRDVSAVFGISAGTAEIMLKILILYLLTGSLLSFLWPWMTKKSGKAQGNAEAYFKTTCRVCGGHIQFTSQNLGQIIPCPHCQIAIALQKFGTLKMSCALCGGHLEFPDNALGQKIPCPHCNNVLVLKEPA